MTPYYEEDGITIWHADCADILPTIDRPNVVITDPPYDLPADAAFKVTGFDSAASYNTLNQRGWRSMLDQSRYIAEWCGATMPTMMEVQAGHTAAGFDPFCPFVMVKTMAARVPYRVPFVWSFEPCIISKRKGAKWGGDGNVTNSWMGAPPNANRNGEDRRTHPAQKPVSVMRQLVTALTAPGDLILDPFMGSGPIAQAAKDLGRQYVGIEIVEEYCATAVNRLAQQVLPL